MHNIYALKDALCEELEKYGDKEISAGTLEIVDTLAHALKNVNRIIADYEQEEEMYSGRSYRNSYNADTVRETALALGMIPVSEAETVMIRSVIPEQEPEWTWWENFKWQMSMLFANA